MNDKDDDSVPDATTRAGVDTPQGVQPDVTWLEPAGPARAAVLLLHGLDMTPAQLAPLLRSLRLPAWVALPAGPVERPGG
ncbi:MAG TPA: hypothetical protein VF453_04760, partial [Burkholderiaceae bacterium]